jgi:hypothetical protein
LWAKASLLQTPASKWMSCFFFLSLERKDFQSAGLFGTFSFEDDLLCSASSLSLHGLNWMFFVRVSSENYVRFMWCHVSFGESWLELVAFHGMLDSIYDGQRFISRRGVSIFNVSRHVMKCSAHVSLGQEIVCCSDTVRDMG